MPKLDLPLVAQCLDITCAAACFESMYRYFEGASPGEMHFADLLGTLELGYTPPENIASLASSYGWSSELKEGARLNDLVMSLERGAVIFVTWWDEDAGHYSLVTEIGESYIVLMDPWLAREGKRHEVNLVSFLSYWELRGCKMISVLK